MTESRLPSPIDHAVVVGLDLNGLGLVRALASAHVPVIALDTDLGKPTAMTRFGEKLRARALAGPDLIEDLLRLRGRLSANPVLLLTQEASVATVSASRDRLANAYRFTLPPHALMEDLLDKVRFQALAEPRAFPIPRAVRFSRDGASGDAGGLKYPCVLKPTTKDPEYGKRFAKAYKVTSAAEALRLWSEMESVVAEVIVQEWIEGGDQDVFFCLQYRPRTGKPVSFVGRKVCQWPPLVGGTASCMPAPEAARDLTALTDGFFDAVGFVGIGSMEYKRDVRDGRFYMVEPTVGRTDYQEEIATLNGVNIPLAAYWGELGFECAAEGPAGRLRAWRDPVGYWKARMAGAPDPISQLAPGIEICDAYFRFDDPMPYLALKFQPAKRRWSALRRALG